jgi:hypothetical protein
MRNRTGAPGPGKDFDYWPFSCAIIAILAATFPVQAWATFTAVQPWL